MNCLMTIAQCIAIAIPTFAAPSTIYVSKLGDNTDGSSWESAYRTIQQALSAVPDDKGGYRIIIRPDTYFEANLYPSNKGAQGAYNLLIGDVNGEFGSGRSGRVIIDSSDPGQQGFKSYDWWGPIKATSQGWSPEHTDETFSSICWDRWTFRNLYVTGGDAGIFFDGTNHVEPFTVVVEDCVSIGRAFGGGVASVLSRADEPITFRRSYLMALDQWGDTAAAYARCENETMPAYADVVFEDCALISPQCDVKASNFGFHTKTRVALKRCKLIVLNFSQPVGTPSLGIIQSVQHGSYLHVDFTDCTLMGYKVFGCIQEPDSAKEIGYTTRGDCKAYVQYQQEMPAGFHRLPHWPANIFDAINVPPAPPAKVILDNREFIRENMCELSPFYWKGRLCYMDSVRPPTGGGHDDYYLLFTDGETGEEMGRCGTGYGLASVLVHDDTLYTFASQWDNGNWTNVTCFSTKDFKNWKQTLAIQSENEGIFNTSVCEGPDGFVMTYESNEPIYPAFTVKIARSTDLETWTKMPEATFGTDRYTACPCIRYSNGYYYVLYLEARSPRHYFETYITRSKDLIHWELSSANPVISPDEIDDGVNASDPELIEIDGKAWLYYNVGDQLTWMNVKRARYDGTLAEFFQAFYNEPGVPDYGAISYHK